MKGKAGEGEEGKGMSWYEMLVWMGLAAMTGLFLRVKCW
jgi:hypothetical protein